MFSLIFAPTSHDRSRSASHTSREWGRQKWSEAQNNHSQHTPAEIPRQNPSLLVLTDLRWPTFIANRGKRHDHAWVIQWRCQHCRRQPASHGCRSRMSGVAMPTCRTTCCPIIGRVRYICLSTYHFLPFTKLLVCVTHIVTQTKEHIHVKFSE
jgi:hypothetical protein